jgi:ABC-type antimicrobial peptide transport system permease subunit
VDEEARSLLTGAAIAIGVMVVITLGIVTESLKTTAASNLQTGKANRGATIVAIIVGALIVMNTMLLSLVERTREFGILGSVGWTRRRVVALITAACVGFLGALYPALRASFLTPNEAMRRE